VKTHPIVIEEAIFSRSERLKTEEKRKVCSKEISRKGFEGAEFEEKGGRDLEAETCEGPRSSIVHKGPYRVRKGRSICRCGSRVFQGRNFQRAEFFRRSKFPGD